MKQWNIHQSTIFFISLLTIFSILFVLSKSLYNSYQLDIRLSEFEERNDIIRDKSDNLKNLISYYESDTYKDKYAKEMFNMLNVGEKVIIQSQEIENVLIPQSELLRPHQMKKNPIFEWKEYFFGKEKITDRMDEYGNFNTQ